VKWRNNRDVLILSTKHQSADISGTAQLRRKKGQTPREEVKKPKCVFENLKGLGSFDLEGQVTPLFCIMRRTVKGHRKIFFYIVDMCIFNSFVLHQKITSKKKTGYSNFKLNIAQKLLENVQLPE
jgi:hypothetical protein